MPAGPRSSDQYYDRRGNRAGYRPSHDTADVVYRFHNRDTGAMAKGYQGGVRRAEDLEFLQEFNIRLVINCTQPQRAAVGQPAGDARVASLPHRRRHFRCHALSVPSAALAARVRVWVRVRVCVCVCVRVRVWVPAAPAAF